MLNQGKNQGGGSFEGGREHYYVNLNFSPNVVNDERQLQSKFEQIINALEEVSDKYGERGNQEEYEQLVQKIDEAINYKDTTLDVNENQLSYLSMACNFIQDQQVRQNLEQSINQVKGQNITGGQNVRGGQSLGKDQPGQRGNENIGTPGRSSGMSNMPGSPSGTRFNQESGLGGQSKDIDKGFSRTGGRNVDTSRPTSDEPDYGTQLGGKQRFHQEKHDDEKQHPDKGKKDQPSSGKQNRPKNVEGDYDPDEEGPIV